MKTLKELREFAENNVIHLDKFLGMMSGKIKPIGDDPRFVTTFEKWRVVFSIEIQPIFKERHVRHMSISGPLIDFTTIEYIKDELGFSGEIITWTEDLGDVVAYNIAQEIE